MAAYLMSTLQLLVVASRMRSPIDDYIALTLWSLVVLSIGLTFAATALRSPRIMFAAAAVSIVPGILGILSIGILFLMLAILQVTAALALRRFFDRDDAEGF